MQLTIDTKKEIFGKYGKSEADTGSADAQVALFTLRIKHLTEHLKVNKKDFVTKRSLQKMVGKRKSLLDYIKKKDVERYRSLIAELGLRK
jgi:small subunit ribosomal protein S15